MKLKKAKFHYSYDACLRITGCGYLHEEITSKTRLIPTHSHRKGEIANSKTKRKHIQDSWILESPLRETAKMGEARGVDLVSDAAT